MEIKTFAKLKKHLKKDLSNLPELRLSILGECATQLLTQAIRGYGLEYGHNLHVQETDYNQVDLLLMNRESEVFAFDPQFISIFLSTPKLLAKFQATATEERCNFAQKTLERINDLIASVESNSQARLILSNYPEFDDSVFGNFSAKVDSSFLYQLRKINLILMERAQENSRLFLLDIATIQNRLGKDQLIDAKLYVNADMIYGMDAIPIIAKHLTDIIFSIQGRFSKCLVLDLDNTLWGGIIGDDGLEGIQLGSLGIGKAFTEFQRWIVQLKDRGIILAVCSKNTESVAKEPFEKHPDMAIRLDDISIFVANWENKVDNIRHIQKILNIGFDSIIFLDDNPFERNMVRSAISEIQVPELPEDPACYVDFLSGQNLFETASYIQGDKDRAKQYQAEAKRISIQKSYDNEDDYLASLDMEAQIQDFTKFNTPRVAQLSQRSNQFNLRTERYTEEEITRIAESPDHIGLAFTLSDKYGEHGLISVIILEKKDNSLFIDTWIMSCRVLKRDVEFFVLDTIVKKAREVGATSVTGEYLPTPKNAMVSDHYKRLDFEKVGELWVLSVEDFESPKYFISEKQGN